MDVKYLNYILAIANRHNMTKAAEDLFVSQSSLSQYLSRLQQELGTPLFIRSKGELSLTSAGVLYVEAAQKVVKIQKDLYQNIAALSQKGRIRVGVTSNWGLRMLTEIIPLFREQGGIRPVLIIQNDVGNCYSPTVIVAAITSRPNKHWIPTHIELGNHVRGLHNDSVILLEQVRTIDRIRLRGYVGSLSGAMMRKVDEAILVSFGVTVQRRT